MNVAATKGIRPPPPAEESLRSLLHHTPDLAADYLESLPTRPVVRPASAAELRERLGSPLPDDPVPARDIVSELAAAAERGIVASNGGRYFGFVEGGVLPAALAADWLTSAWDQNPGMYTLSPAAAVAEEVCAAGCSICSICSVYPWMRPWLHNRRQMANLVGLAAGRHHVLAAAGTASPSTCHNELARAVNCPIKVFHSGAGCSGRWRRGVPTSV